MELSEQRLLDLLQGDKEENSLSATQLAHLYINSALLVTIMEFLKEQLWLQNQEDKKLNEVTSYEDFINPFFNDELLPISFLKEFLIERGSENIKKISHASKKIETNVLGLIIKSPNDEQKTFVIQSLEEMEVHFLHEEKDQQGRLQGLGHKGLMLYRTFDNLDIVFNLNYQLDFDMEIDPHAVERLYQSGGAGVQSGYSTILLALDFIKAKGGAKMIDLGSGYGRVGLVCSLLRPDIEFIGFEFVPHRVDISNKATLALDLSASLQFKTQDLSLKSFKIPDADVFYLYDPFTKETYNYVLKQMVELSKKHLITIITKGNARSWLTEVSVDNNWPDPVLLDHGNLCIFKSA